MFSEFSLIGLALIAVGTGGIKPCVSSFGGMRNISLNYSITYINIEEPSDMQMQGQIALVQLIYFAPKSNKLRFALFCFILLRFAGIRKRRCAALRTQVSHIVKFSKNFYFYWDYFITSVLFY
jgi:hypothetical protein